ncbi:solute carrier family 23 protein [Breoghania sp.]|uniref:solute carrier family 23 protein n=1 Tax=Breoghania sp. TaxID=2065378 RepID=UPI003204C24A
MSEAQHLGVTPEQMRDPNWTPSIEKAVPLGIQHVLAMFVSNFTPSIIISLAAGYVFGSPDMVYLVLMAMVFSGIATLIQTISIGPVGAKLPVVQGTSFAFIPVMIPVVKTVGMAALFGGVVIGGIFHSFIGTVIGRFLSALPPLVTGIVVISIGLVLIPVGIQYATGGVPLMGKPELAPSSTGASP